MEPQNGSWSAAAALTAVCVSGHKMAPHVCSSNPQTVWLHQLWVVYAKLNIYIIYFLASQTDVSFRYRQFNLNINWNSTSCVNSSLLFSNSGTKCCIQPSEPWYWWTGPSTYFRPHSVNSSGSCSFLGSNFEHFKVPKPKDSGLEKLYNHIERVSISSVGKNQVKGTL